MEFSIRHAIPGRLRLRVPLLRRKSPLGDALLHWLGAQSGVKGVRVNYDCASLIVEYDPGQTPALKTLLFHLQRAGIEQIRSVVAMSGAAGAGGSAETALGAARKKPAAAPRRWPLLAPSISFALALSANPMARAVNVPFMLWNAFPIARRAWRVWSRERRLNIDFLDVLAIGASIGQGLHVTGTMIIWLIRLGDWIRDQTAAGSKRAISELLEFQAKTAWVVRDGAVQSIPATQLVVDDTVVVHPGEMIPVDGEVLDGEASVDQKNVTGESVPVTRGRGDAVYAATVIHDGQLTLRATRVGVATIAGQIAQLVDAAPVGDTRIQNHAERFADRLVLPTLALATGTAAVTGDINRFLSLVIVDYGTGIRVAAPTSVLSSMTHAARAGIIIKSGGHMERLAEVDTIVFDKTGTLTQGVPAVGDVISYRPGIDPHHLLALAAAAETRLKHPVAEALRTKARELRLPIPTCAESRFNVGLGVEGQVNGYYLHVGSERFLRKNDIRVGHIAGDRSSLDERGLSCLYVAVDGVLAGLVAYADQIRPESKEVIAALHGMGIRQAVMLTGDNAVVARAVGGRLGLDRQFADMMPADKASVIQDLRREGRIVAMVGDGLNDSPALSYADVGIAMKHGAEVTHESAHVVLMEDSLWKIVKAVSISRGAVRLIKQNYGIVAALNTTALALALPGSLVSPLVVAMISNGSAVLASLNAIRPALRRP